MTLWDALALGIRALVFSANIQAPEDEKIEGGMLALTLVPSLLFAVAVFMLLPIGIAYLAERFLAWNAWQSNLLEGFVRLGLLLAYLAAIRRVADIRRVYMYHGAEHKTINAFEDGAELNIEGVRPYSRQHPRCGTAFLLTVFVFSILLFSAIGPLPMLTRIISRLVLLPLLASLAYEYIRFTGTLRNHTLAKILMAPNLWLQNMTTAEPDDDMLAIAIAAFKAMYSEEQRLAAEASAVSYCIRSTGRHDSSRRAEENQCAARDGSHNQKWGTHYRRRDSHRWRGNPLDRCNFRRFQSRIVPNGSIDSHELSKVRQESRDQHATAQAGLV
ncbi:MAG: DUF1385 domain-containing protein [Anaerolineales bacterium]